MSGFPVYSGGRRKNKPPDIVLKHALYKIDAAGYVIFEKSDRIFEGCFHLGICGEMNDSVYFIRFEYFADVMVVSCVGLNKNSFIRDGSKVAFAQVIQGNDPITAIYKYFR